MKRPGEEFDASALKRQDASETGRPPSPDISGMDAPGGSGWEQHVSSKTGKTYWFNPGTGQTQWTSPHMVFLPRSPPPEPSETIAQQDHPKSQLPQLSSIDGTKISIDISAANNYPKRPGQQRCTYYLKKGICKFGESCKFDHPDDR